MFLFSHPISLRTKQGSRPARVLYLDYIVKCVFSQSDFVCLWKEWWLWLLGRMHTDSWQCYFFPQFYHFMAVVIGKSEIIYLLSLTWRRTAVIAAWLFWSVDPNLISLWPSFHRYSIQVVLFVLHIRKYRCSFQNSPFQIENIVWGPETALLLWRGRSSRTKRYFTFCFGFYYPPSSWALPYSEGVWTLCLCMWQHSQEQYQQLCEGIHCSWLRWSRSSYFCWWRHVANVMKLEWNIFFSMVKSEGGVKVEVDLQAIK